MVSDREVRLAMADVHENYRRWIEEMNEQNRHAANGGPWVRHDPETSKRTVIGLRPGHGLRLYDPDRGGHEWYAPPDGGPVRHFVAPYSPPVAPRL